MARMGEPRVGIIGKGGGGSELRVRVKEAESGVIGMGVGRTGVGELRMGSSV